MCFMAGGGLFVYSSARDAHEQITRLSDFISPTVIAMWNLRWQVRGFLEAHPNATQSDIVNRFALGSGIRGNEIQRACVENTWEDQQDRFAGILLTNTISIFEEFAERLVGLTLHGDQKRRAWKALQYPNSPDGRGYQRAYSALGGTVPALRGVFNDPSHHSRWYSGAQLQNLLLCFRFFKEIRNAPSHNGGRATPELIEAFNNFAPIATTTDLKVKEVPTHSVPVLNDKVHIDLRGMNGFSNIVLRIIATYDTDLSDRQGAKLDIERRIGKIHGAARARVDETKREKRIRGLLISANLPKANLTKDFMDLLRGGDKIPTYW